MSSGGRGRIKVAVADDHPLFRQGVIGVLAASPEIQVVGQAQDGFEALQLVADAEPDVLLLDLRMPRMDGYETLRRLNERHSTCRVIVLSLEDRRFAEQWVMSKGADAYMPKDANPSDLLACILEVAQRPTAPTRLAEQTADSLPTRQLQVLKAIIEGKTNAEIASELWISERTVKHHVSGVLAHFGVTRRGQLAAMGMGTLAPPDEAEPTEE